MLTDSTGYSPESDDLLRGTSGVLILTGLVIASLCTGGGALLLAGVLVSAGSGSYFVGQFAEENGGSYSTGWVSGVVAGTIMGVTTGVGGSFLMAESLTVSSISIGVGLTFGGGFASGAFGYVTHQFMTNSSVNINVLTTAGAYGMIAAPFFTFSGAAATGFAELGMLGMASSALTASIVIDYTTQAWYDKASVN